ncbi:hypothetical protein [Chryseobacterium populi]|uniref:Uncharacterized protein n=1 Tax=Chryseobacterium populi TaxID=1144316 RepID=J2K688_9FLAO|nr:hypothetical protein [Chryseobacterium populi]EJL68748.1 hypothetical protein PMI13_03501 [Chryseobacterium populi]
MKKLILLLLCLIFANLFSQEYHFDYFIEEVSNRTKPEKEQWISNSFYDSKNKFILDLVSFNNKTRAYIFEEGKELRHSFKVDQKNNMLSFEYTHSSDFEKRKKINESNKANVFKITKVDSLRYEIIVFKDEKKKKKKFTALVNLEKSDFNYLNIHADYGRCDEIEEKLAELLDPDSKYIIKKMHLEYSNGYFFDMAVTKIQKTNLILKIPEKLVMREFENWSEFEE